VSVHWPMVLMHTSVLANQAIWLALMQQEYGLRCSRYSLKTPHSLRAIACIQLDAKAWYGV
jgi:hypothetical protein